MLVTRKVAEIHRKVPLFLAFTLESPLHCTAGFSGSIYFLSACSLLWQRNLKEHKDFFRESLRPWYSRFRNHAVKLIHCNPPLRNAEVAWRLRFASSTQKTLHFKICLAPSRHKSSLCWLKKLLFCIFLRSSDSEEAFETPESTTPVKAPPAPPQPPPEAVVAEAAAAAATADTDEQEIRPQLPLEDTGN